MSQDSGYVYVSYRDVRDSARVYITRVASIELLPHPLILMVGGESQIQKEYENLVTTRRRQLEKPLNEIESLRTQP